MRKAQIEVAAGWLVVGIASANAAPPTRVAETTVADQVTAGAGPAHVTEASGPSLGSPGLATGREPEEPAAATSLLLPGSKVRVHPMSAASDDDAPLEGTLLDADGASFRVRVDEGVVTIPRGEIRRVEVALGQSRQTWKWLGIGAACGAGTGVVLGFLSTGCTFTSCPSSKAEADAKVLRGTAIGAAIGAGIGAAIGHSIERATGWTDVPLERVHVSVAPAWRHGFGLALTVGF